MLKSLKFSVLSLILAVPMLSQSAHFERAQQDYLARQEASIEACAQAAIASFNLMALMGRMPSQEAVTSAILAYAWVGGRWILQSVERQVPGGSWGLRWASRLCVVGAAAAIIQSHLLA